MTSRSSGAVAVLLGVRFALELTLLVAVAVWGLGRDSSWPVRLLVGVGGPVLVALLWGLFISPKAAVPMPLPARLGIELALFLAAAAGLWSTGYEAWAVTLIVLEVVTVAMLVALGRPPGT